ncbi:hypothetical protein N665_0435s0015 [Sinapis alba]|nr:hypothetical protein N665_0435s0015 [Sinapis alba]
MKQLKLTKEKDQKQILDPEISSALSVKAIGTMLTSTPAKTILDSGEVISEDEKPKSDFDDESLEYPAQGDILMCSLIIDRGSCTNVASETLVKKRKLQVQVHPKPYSLMYLNEEGEMRVVKKVKVSISTGRYQDEFVCDVLPMDAIHILLGRLWQSDKRLIHDSFTNQHTFSYKEKHIILVLLNPKEKSRDVFPEDNYIGLPHIRGIEHQINFVLGGCLPNRPAYMTNPVETKELKTRAIKNITFKYKHPIPRLDDMLDELYGSFKTMEEHIKLLRKVLDMLRKENLYANYKKCSFGTDDLVFLCFVISAHGIHVDEEKIKTIQYLPTPQTIGEDFSSIAAPLIEEIKKSVGFT